MGISIRCFVQGYGLQIATIMTMGMTVSNSAFMGFPIAEQIIGSTASASLVVYVSVENLIMLPLLLVLAELGAETKGHWLVIARSIIKRLMTNPLIISILIGVLFSAFKLHLLPPLTCRRYDL